MKQKLNRIFYTGLIIAIILSVFKITIYPIISGNHFKYELLSAKGQEQTILVHEIIQFALYSVLYSLGFFVLLRRKNNTAEKIPWGELFLAAISLSFLLTHIICFALEFFITINLDIQIYIFYTILAMFYLCYLCRYPFKTGTKVKTSVLNIIGWILSIFYIIFGLLILGALF